jgi:hypothetical protein
MANQNALIRIKYPTRGARRIFQAQAEEIPAGWEELQNRAAEIHIEELAKRTPVGDGGEPGNVTEHMRDAWAMRTGIRAGKSARIVYNRKGALRFVLAGRPAIDNTKRGRPLHFWWHGKEFFRWRVKATLPNPFHLGAIAEAESRVAREIGRGLRELLQRTHVKQS